LKKLYYLTFDLHYLDNDYVVFIANHFSHCSRLQEA